MLKEPMRSFSFPFNIIVIFVSLSTDLVTLHVSPEVTAECGTQVNLTCHVSPVDGLSIKRMVWFQDKPLCSVDSEGNLTINDNNTPNGFHCEYQVGQLSLIFEKVQPLDIGQYMCKLHSNWGAKLGSTDVKLKGQTPHLFLCTHKLVLKLFS